ncbi:MAG: hypothetical protein QM784_25980 [Polyangiaceae bacterium]
MSPRQDPRSNNAFAAPPPDRERANHRIFCTPGALATFGSDGLSQWMKELGLDGRDDGWPLPIGPKCGKLESSSLDGPIRTWLENLGWSVEIGQAATAPSTSVEATSRIEARDSDGPHRPTPTTTSVDTSQSTERRENIDFPFPAQQHRWLWCLSGNVQLPVLVVNPITPRTTGEPPDQTVASHEFERHAEDAAESNARGQPVLTHELHRQALEDILFVKRLHVGLLFTPTSVSFVLRDDYATCHELVQGSPDTREGLVMVDDDHLASLGLLCKPRVVEMAPDLARRTVIEQRDESKRFGAELVRGLTQFLDEISRDTGNR